MRLKEKLVHTLSRSPMLATLMSLTGNARVCIWTEPLWGIPYNTCLPYVSLFMVGLGLSPTQIGTVASIFLVSQFVFAILSGVLADKLGRRLCTLIFDTLSWSVPELLWACSQDFTWFVVAALFNGAWRITETSWGLLLVEDTPQDKVVNLFSLTQFMGLFAAFFTPLSGYFVSLFGVVPTMRVLYGITCLSMTAKFVILFVVSKETEMGKRRMRETKGVSVFHMLWECKDVFLSMLRTPQMIITIAITAVYQIIGAINGNFWALLITSNLQVPEKDVALFTTARTLVVMFSIFKIAPKLHFERFKPPMMTGWLLMALSQLLLIVAPAGKWALALLAVSVLLEGCAMSILTPMVESLLFINADPVERARILGLVYATTLLMVSVFPMMAGLLAEINIVLPFCINLMMFALGALLTVWLWKIKQRRLPAAQAQ